MTDIVAVFYNDEITATVSSDYQTTVQAVGIQGVSGTSSTLESMQNVDATNLQNGSLLIYNTTATKWIASTHLDAQDMDAGEF